MNRARTFAACAALLVILVAVAAEAQGPNFAFEVRGQARGRVDILVLPLDVVSGGTEAQEAAWLLESIIKADMEHSGWFSVKAPADSASVKWGVEGVFEGRLPGTAVTEAEAAPLLTLRLMSYPDRKAMLNKQYRPTWDQMRATAHHFVDEVIALLMDEVGICQTRIVFARGAADRRDIWCVDFDGQNPLRLTANRRLNLFPTWSPDNELVAFMSWRNGQQGIYLLETRSGEVRLVNESAGSNQQPSWHPDGRELLVSLSKIGQHEIYRMGLDGKILRRLTVSPAIEVSPAWSPTGRDVVFTSDRTGTPQLYVMQEDGAGRRRLTNEGRYNDSAKWSPDGKTLVYATRVNDLTRLAITDPLGSGMEYLTDRTWGNCEDPSWAPDSRHIVFTSDRTGTFKLYVMDLVDRTTRQLTFGEEPDTTPDWSR